MSLALLAAIAFALALWWVSTGVILWLSRLPRAAEAWALGVATGLAAIAGLAIAATRDVATPAGAFAAFSAALALWGWHELTFLTGRITGPSQAPCPPRARGWARFRAAAATLMHHEVALALTALAVAALTLPAANPIGGWTFLLLFAARLSSKLNLFLGAPNFSVELFPARLAHMAGYLRRGPVSALYPFSLAGLALACAVTAKVALAPDATAFEATGHALLLTLAALAALEHAFMALPVPDAALWRWALPAAERPASRLPADAVEPTR